MVNEEWRAAAASERALALSYAPADARDAVAALWALDDRLWEITRAARDPLIGTMRLTWWREALERLDVGPAPAEPLLRALAAEVLPRVSGATLAGLTEGWERVLAGEVDWAEVARERGGRLFALAAVVLGADDVRVEDVGAVWARVDLAARRPEAGPPDAGILEGAYRVAWPRRLRALGALGLLARFDAAGAAPPGSPRRVARLLAHRLTGR